MSKKKQNRKLFEEPQGTPAEANVAETATENLEATPETVESVSVSITYENDINEPKPTEQVIMEAEM